MPRSVGFIRKSLRSVCVDTVLFFAMFTLVGHLTVNFWERYTIKNELASMKENLRTMKSTITSVGKAYDTLHTELKDLFYVVDDQRPQWTKMHKRDIVDNRNCKHDIKSDKDKHLHDFQVQAAITNLNKIGVGVETEKRKQPAIIVELQNKATAPLGTNAATNTKYPPKSVGTTSDAPYYNREPYYKRNDCHVYAYHNHVRGHQDARHYNDHVCKHV